MPGSQKAEVPGMGVAEAKGGLPGQEGPLSYLRSRNALKIILDLDEEFGRKKLRMPGGEEGWRGVSRVVGGGK